MLYSVYGVYRDGKIEFNEPVPRDIAGPVIVTFLDTPASAIDLSQRGLDARQAADLRGRLAAFAEDWQRPEMDVYDALAPGAVPSDAERAAARRRFEQHFGEVDLGYPTGTDNDGIDADLAAEDQPPNLA